MKRIKVSLEAVIWRDACHSLFPTNENTDPPWVVDVGFIIKANKDHIVIVRQFFDDGFPRHGMTILRSNIQKITRIGWVTLPENFKSGPVLEVKRE